MMLQQVSILADSISLRGHRLTTFRLRIPKFILVEFNTHRMLSRNAGSSRAIPTKRLLEECRSAWLRVTPVNWPKNQPGMSSDEYLVDEDLPTRWGHAAMDAACHAEALAAREVHKQVSNRVM